MMPDELVPPTDASRFQKMAERIEHNANSTFGGAAVIVPPADGGDPIEIMLLDSRGDVAQFWSTLKTRIDIRIAELQMLQMRQQSPYGR